MAGLADGESRVVTSPLGPITLRLPAGAHLSRDPGVVEGTQLWWDAFSVSFGAQEGWSADSFLDLERSASGRLLVENDDAIDVGDGVSVRELRLTVESEVARHWSSDQAGRHEEPARVERERLRFRFWSFGDHVVSAGYRMPDGDPKRQALLDSVLDSVRVGGS